MLCNNVSLIGRLGADPTVRILNKDTGTKVANISIATDRYYKNSEGESVKETLWNRGVLFGSLALRAEKFLQKGKQIALQGYLRTREWTDDKGVKRYATEVVAEALQMLGPAPNQTPPVDAYADDPAAYGIGNMGDATALAAVGAGGNDDVPF